jgi:hypothetical protein
MKPYLYYILHADHTVTSTTDVIEWARQFEGSHYRRVALTNAKYRAEVSTVFLGIDHSLSNGPPLLFETMVFGGPMHNNQVRYSTYDEALRGHDLMVMVCNDCTLWDYLSYLLHFWYSALQEWIFMFGYRISRKFTSLKKFLERWYHRMYHNG